jgi:hypothetical protein
LEDFQRAKSEEERFWKVAVEVVREPEGREKAWGRERGSEG